MWDFLKAYGDKLLTFLTGVAAIFSTPQVANSLGLNETDVAWITVTSACLALAHTVFISSSTQQAAVRALKAPTP
jgi:hypothetical protein